MNYKNWKKCRNCECFAEKPNILCVICKIEEKENKKEMKAYVVLPKTGIEKNIQHQPAIEDKNILIEVLNDDAITANTEYDRNENEITYTVEISGVSV